MSIRYLMLIQMNHLMVELTNDMPNFDLLDGGKSDIDRNNSELDVNRTVVAEDCTSLADDLLDATRYSERINRFSAVIVELARRRPLLRTWK